MHKRSLEVAQQTFCEECGISDTVRKVRRRKCTNSPPLCSVCLSAPQHKILSETNVRRIAPNLDKLQYPDPVATIVNCIHPAFPRQRVYFWVDIAMRCEELGIDMFD